jgi:predicted lactoylglutathione lyase
MAKLIFIKLPVSDLARATVFYQAIGAVKNARFSDDTASCMVFSDTIHAMLMTHDKYRQFTTKKIADAKTTSLDFHGAESPNSVAANRFI